MHHWIFEHVGLGWYVIFEFVVLQLKITLFATYWIDRERINHKIYMWCFRQYCRLEEFVHRSKVDDWRLLKERKEE